MVEIRHKQTGAVLLQQSTDTLERANLAGANFCDADLRGANLSGADLTGALFRNADLRGANLTQVRVGGAYFFLSDLREANLSGAFLFSDSFDSADLTDANLTGANLTGAYLAEAKLVRTTLTYANLQSTYLGGADLTGARAGFTVFSDCPSLCMARGLETMAHLGPSTIDIRTLRASAAALPDVFLRSVGLRKEEIEQLRTLSRESVQYHSCLLASESADRDFVDRLQSDLLDRNVSCWLYHPDLCGGYLAQVVFDHWIRKESKLLLIASAASIQQGEVAAAAQAVLGHEPGARPHRLVLILLDDQVYNDVLGSDNERTGDWARSSSGGPVIDFRHWKQEDAYRTAFGELLRALEYAHR
jgi:hypothetical protein